MSMNAIIYPGDPDRYLFYPGPIGPAERHMIAQKGGTIQDGVTLDDPPEVHRWPDGDERPDAVLCRHKRDEADYKVFRYRREVGPDYEALPAIHAKIGMARSLAASLESLARLDALDEITDESDTAELWEEIHRTSGGAR